MLKLKDMSKVFDGEFPRSISAEESLLASIILHPESYWQIADSITEEDFFLEKHKRIYSAIGKLIEESKPIDLISIEEIVKPYISAEELYSIIEKIPSVIHIEEYARIIKEKSVLRKLMEISNETLKECITELKDPDEILEKVDRNLYEIFISSVKSDFESISSIVERNVKHLEAIGTEKHFISGIATGFDKLDELTGGFQKSDYIIIAGRPSTGKTSFALSMSLEMAKRGKKVAFISLEMAKEQIGLRLLCANSGIDLKKVRSGYLSAKDFKDLVQSANEIEKLKIFVDDTTPYYIHEIRPKCRKLMKTEGIDILFIDYIQLIRTKERYDTRNLQLGAISSTLKSIAKEFNIPIVALSQLSRNPEKRREKDIRPTMADLRESGNLEQDADLVLLLYRNKELDEKNMVEVILEKQRNGPTGSFKLVFMRPFTLFREPTMGDYEVYEEENI